MSIFNNQMSVAQKVISASLAGLVVSTVLGGPLGLVARCERHLLLVLMIIGASFELCRSWRLGSWRLLKESRCARLPMLFVLIRLLWAWAIGGGEKTRLVLALTDVQLLILLPVMMLVFLANRDLHEWFRQLMRFTIILVAILALAQVLVWI